MKKGFTLVEILVALVIFGFMVLALSGVFATANRFFYHQYREDILKTRFITAMKYIQNKMMVANEIITPAYGYLSSNITFITNAVANPSNPNLICRPYSPASTDWHHFCITPCPSPFSGNCLYYHTGQITSISNCPSYSSVPSITPSCGSSALLLTDSISSLIFSRQNIPRNLVRVNISLYSQAKGDQTSSSGIVGRDIAHTFETYISINKASQF